MALKNYQAVYQRVTNILNRGMTEHERKRIPSESKLTYSNGYRMTVSAIFVDIRNSTKLFANKDRDMVSKIVRSFVSEVIWIMKTEDSAEIGVRGDCVYGIYSTPEEDRVYSVFEIAQNINTYLILLNELYAKKKYPEIKVGIGLATGDTLVVKVGSKGTGVTDRVWIGEAVTAASNLSNYGSKNGFKPIVMTESFFKIVSKRFAEVGLKQKCVRKVPVRENQCITDIS